MFADYVARILRRDWTFGLGPIKGKKYDQLSPDELAQSIASTNASLKQLAEEIATLNGLETPLTHRNSLYVQHACQGVATLGKQFWNVEDACSAGVSDNPLSHYKNPDKEQVVNGFAHIFRGVVLLEGSLIIKENNLGGGQVVIVNNAGDVISPVCVAITTSTITARSSTTLGTGPATLQKLTGDPIVVASTLSAQTVYNPYAFVIRSGTYVVVAQMARGSSYVWVIVGVDPSGFIKSSQFDVVTTELELLTSGGVTVPFDIADTATTNTAQIALTATAGEIQCNAAGKVHVTTKVLARRTVNDANFNVWMIWLQKYTAAWAHVSDSQAVGLAYYADQGASLVFSQDLDVAAGNKIRVRAMAMNGSASDVKLISQLQPSIDSTVLHFGPKLCVSYV